MTFPMCRDIVNIAVTSLALLCTSSLKDGEFLTVEVDLFLDL